MVTRPYAIGALCFLFACASNPNKDLKSARDERREHYLESVRTQHTLAEKQHVEDVALQNKHATERRQARESTLNTVLADYERVEAARAAMQKERRMFEIEVKERMAKVDARAGALWVKTATSPEHVRENVTPIWRAYTKGRVTTADRINKLAQQPDDAFPKAKADVNARLGALESTLEPIASKVHR